MSPIPVRRPLSLLLLLVAGLAAVPALAADVEVLDQGPDGFTVRIRLPETVRRTVDLPGGTFTRVLLDGWDAVGDAGAPELPARGFGFGLPSGARATASVVSVTTESFRGAPPVPAPTPEVRDGDAFPVPVETRVVDPDVYGAAGTVPAAWVEVSEPQGWRFQRIASLVVNAVRAVPGAGSYEALREITVAVRFREDGTRSAGRGDRVPAGPDHVEWEQAADRLLLNADSARRFRQRPRPRPGVLGAAQTAEPSVRVRLGGSGLVRLSYADLAVAGFPADVPVDEVRVEEREVKVSAADPFVATAIPRRVEDNNGNGVFDAGDRVVFFGYDFEERYRPAFSEARYGYFHAYWVVRGDGVDFPGGPAPPGGPYETVTSFPHSVHSEENRLYIDFPPDLAGQFLPRRTTLYWRGPRSNESIQQITVVTPGVDPDGEVRFAASWQGAFLEIDHEETIDVNGTIVLDKILFFGLQSMDWSGDPLPSAGLLVDGDNRVEVRGTHPPVGQGDLGFGSGAYFDFLRTTYDRLPVARDDALRFNSGSAGGPFEITVTGFGSDDLLVLDITDPVAPFLAPADVEDAGDGTYRVVLRADASTGQRRYFAGVPASHDGLPESPHPLPPDLAGGGFVGPGPQRDLLAAGAGSDYVIVTHRDLVPEFQRLADHRAAQGHVPLLVTVDEVYDQFGGGHKSPGAIRNFLYLAFRAWETPPLWLLLGGDGSEDYRKDLNTSTVDYVPTMMHLANVPGARGIRELAGTDAWYVQSLAPGDGVNDAVPEMFVGRLTASSLAEAKILVDKIIAYEAMDPADEWRNRGFFQADDEYSTSITFTSGYCWKPGEASFSRTTREVCAKIDTLAGLTDFECVEYHQSALLDTVAFLGRNPGNPQNCPSSRITADYVRTNLTPGFIEELSRGFLVWGFTGHANRILMTTETVFSQTFNDDVSRIDNFGKPFIFQGYACHLNEFEHSNETSGGKAIGEALLESPNAGAVASMASTGYEWLHTNSDAQLAGTAPLFWDLPRDPDTGRPRRLLGEANTLGFLNLAIEKGFRQDWVEMLRTYLLLGDPALRVDVARPGFAVEVEGESFPDGGLLVADSFGDSLLVSAVVSDDADVSTLRVREGGEELPPDRLALTPPDPGGDGRQDYGLEFRTRLRLDTYDVAIEAQDWTGRLAVFGMRVETATDFTADGLALTPGGENLIDSTSVVAVEVTTPAPVEAGAFRLVVDGRERAADPVNLDDGAGRRWSVGIGSEWGGGPHEASLILTEGDQSLTRTMAFEVPTDAVELQEVYFYPNPYPGGEGGLTYRLTNSARAVRVEVYTVSGRKILSTDDAPGRAGWNTYSWQGIDALGDEVGNGVYLFVLRVEGEGADDEPHVEKVAVTR